MKKIVMLLITIFIFLSSFLYILLYSDQEFLSIVEGSDHRIKVSNSVDPEETIRILNEASITYDTTIFMKEFEPEQQSLNGSFQLYISQYTDDFMKRLEYKEINGKLTAHTYISSQRHENEYQIGYFRILHQQSGIVVKSLETAGMLNLNTVYYLTTHDDHITYQIINFLKSEGLEVEKYDGPRAQSGVYQKLLKLIGIVFVLMILTTLYQYILDFKDIAVKKLNGYDDKTIQKEYVNSFLKMNGILGFIMTLIILVISMLTYQTVNYHFIGNFIIVISIVILVLSFIYGALSFFVRSVDIALMLKNKKPLDELQIVNYVAITFFMLIVIYVGVTAVGNITDLLGQNSNLRYWESTKDYAFTTISAMKATEHGDFYKDGRKMQCFYRLMDEKGAILFYPSSYYFQDETERTKIQTIQKGPQYNNEVISVNENYLLKHPIKDIHGNQVTVDLHDKNRMTILIPEKYKNQKDEIEAAYRQEYQELRYFDENLYRKRNGEKAIEQMVSIQIVFVKDEQHYFSYDPDVEIEHDNFIVDPIVKIITAENQGTDVYASMLSQGALFMKVKDHTQPYIELKPYLIQTDLSTQIRSTPSLYSKFSEKIYSLYMSVFESVITLVFSFVTMIMIKLFMTMNYLEKNKMDYAVKTLHGYSFWACHDRYILANSIAVILSGFVIGIWVQDILPTGIITGLLFIIHISGLIFILKWKGFKGIRNTLNGS